MRTAIYLDKKRLQLVLTPETEIDKIVTERLRSADLREATIHEGGFFPNEAGYTRHCEPERTDSVMVVLDNKDSTQ